MAKKKIIKKKRQMSLNTLAEKIHMRKHIHSSKSEVTKILYLLIDLELMDVKKNGPDASKSPMKTLDLAVQKRVFHG